MFKSLTTVALVVVCIAYVYQVVKTRCGRTVVYTNFLHAHVFDRSLEAYESQNATLSLMKVYQAQAALELLAQVAGGDSELSKTCGNINAYRAALYEQLQYYNSLHTTPE